MKKAVKRSAEAAQESIRFSFLVSLSDIAFNLVVSLITGSAVLLSQALQGLSDAVSSALVYFGYRHSKRRADKQHPFGYGREIFFWVLIASVLTGGISGVLSIIGGIDQLRFGSEINAGALAVVVLFVGLMTNGYSVRTAMNSLLEKRSPLDKVKQLLKSSFVETKISVLIDSIGTFSAFVGLIAIGLYLITGNAIFDGYGAIVIGSITIAGSLSLIADLYGFIVGKSAKQEVLDQLENAVLEIDGVDVVKSVKATLIGSGLLLVIVDVVFDQHLTLLQAEHRSVKIRRDLKKISGVRHVIVESDQL